MPFRNRNLAKRVKSKPCEWCGWQSASRFASHIIDEGPEKDWNALSLCPNCSSVFDEVIRPKLYLALKNFGVEELPKSWSKSNKITVINQAE